MKLCNTIDKKNGPFDFMALLGDIGDNTDIETEKPIYFTEGSEKATKNGSGLQFLGPVGTKTLSSGLTVGFVSGNLDDTDEKEISTHFKGYVDILLTYQWPKVISDEEQLATVGNRKLDPLLDLLRPRYWFCVGNSIGRFFERMPFEWDDGRITRFISLARQGSKGKWLYAFNISTDFLDDARSVKKLGSKPQKSPPKRKFESSDEPVKSKRQVVSPNRCFFCLSNPKVELHMIIAIGKYSYMTVAKGPLTLRKSSLGFSGHGLIIMISHYPTLHAYQQSEEPNLKVQDTNLFKEVGKFRSKVAEMFLDKKYATVFWEISRTNGVHLHTQFVPVPLTKLARFDEYLDKQCAFAESRFHQKVTYQKYTNTDGDDKIYEVINSEDYVIITVDAGPGKVTKYLFKLGLDDARVDLQFPRKVVAFLLGLRRRIHWDKCSESTLDETEQRDAFQKCFKPYDFTLEKS